MWFGVGCRQTFILINDNRSKEVVLIDERNSAIEIKIFYLFCVSSLACLIVHNMFNSAAFFTSNENFERTNLKVW